MKLKPKKNGSSYNKWDITQVVNKYCFKLLFNVVYAERKILPVYENIF
jgi:hypothetical protein